MSRCIQYFALACERGPVPYKKKQKIPLSGIIAFFVTTGLVLFVLVFQSRRFSLDNRSSASTYENQVVTLYPSDDSYVNGSYPKSSYGDEQTMTSDRTMNKVAYIKFDLTPYTGETVTTASFNATVESRSLETQNIFMSDSNWNEKSLTNENKPSLGAQVASIGKTEDNKVIQVDLTAVIRQNLGKQITIAIQNPSTDGIKLYTKESAQKPSLIVQFGSGTASPLPTAVATSVPSATTPPPTGPAATTVPSPITGVSTLWMSRTAIAQLPTSGAAWQNVLKYAKNSTTSPDLGNQNDATDTNTVAKALVYARTGDRAYGDQVVATLKTLVNTHPISESKKWDWLGILRSLGSYAISASLIDLRSYDSNFDQNVFRPWLSQARSALVEGGRGSVISAQEKRPNNFGSHAVASRVAADLYLNDTTDLERAITVFRGYLGNRAMYSNTISPGFSFGKLMWQADQSKPVGINPVGAILTINGGLRNVDGVIPDDQRRCSEDKGQSTAVWPPCKTNYTWEATQGNIVAAELLYNAGYPAYEWENKALLRSVQWMYNTTFADGNKFPAEGDDRWLVYIINKRYGTNFAPNPAVNPAKASTTSFAPGKMMGYSDWTHQ